MLPTVTDNGARLAAILPTGIAALAKGLGADPGAVLGESLASPGAIRPPESLPGIRGFVLVVVDGLGAANLRAMRAHAPVLAGLATRRVETVLPSTTAAALTSLCTARLPGSHGLIGYRIRHPELGLISPLKEWQGIDEVREWQRATPLWDLAAGIGARAVAIGRPAHRSGGLTEAILGGAEYLGAQRIEDRLATAGEVLRGGDPALVYVYIDELDKAGHAEGWRSALWVRRLEALDAALDDFLRTMPGGIGVAVTADHGMVDVPPERQVFVDRSAALRDHAFEIGGEPRFRSLYLDPGVDPGAVARELSADLGRQAWAVPRDEAIAAGWFGPVADEVAPRLGEVLVVARAQIALVTSGDSPEALRMIGQHGGLSAEERGVPLSLAGALSGTGFASAVTAVAGLVG
ncbi:alkaline phosphatase family protein [Leucobacter weissii]|uniref:Alkaline phosphatase family protein n=1 Tax=Leucobacter weissii TaxID=1983706 RepID=A0A939MN61_9MICO|nr:nucleotide pyrophosphatase/phosphodiesterase family protein [Leucobacter weissii]MBO1901877.1 alkaline phosphatase family protein [Leucobacter weissii]